jgi:hypothetical protein
MVPINEQLSPGNFDQAQSSIELELATKQLKLNHHGWFKSHVSLLPHGVVSLARKFFKKLANVDYVPLQKRRVLQHRREVLPRISEK